MRRPRASGRERLLTGEHSRGDAGSASASEALDPGPGTRCRAACAGRAEAASAETGTSRAACSACIAATRRADLGLGGATALTPSFPPPDVSVTEARPTTSAASNTPMPLSANRRRRRARRARKRAFDVWIGSMKPIVRQLVPARAGAPLGPDQMPVLELLDRRVRESARVSAAAVDRAARPDRGDERVLDPSRAGALRGHAPAAAAAATASS